MCDQASGCGSCCCHCKLNEQCEELSVVIHGETTISRCLQEKFNSLKQESPEQFKSRIQKVIYLLRENENFEKYYEPRVVAIGPIHHSNPKFKYAETMKRRLANRFIGENGINAVNLYNKIMAGLENLKNCYVEDVIKEYSNDKLAWMLLVDGCALLQFIHCVVQDDDAATVASVTKQSAKPGKLQELQIKKDQVAFAQQDMFLFENQLPYQLLELILSLIVGKDAIEKSIIKFIHSNMMTTAQPPENLSQTKKPHHLLDLLREQLLVCKPKKPMPTTLQKPHSFRNVKELIASGISLKPTGQSCLDIFFDNCCFMGTLKLPSLVVDDSTAPKFLNLIAYEMCPDFMNDFDVTSYICFLDSLIDHPEDVEELRKAQILTNVLGSDEEVAKLFNKIGTDLVPNQDLYAHVKDKIEKYYKNKCTSWTAQAYHNYFSSPWTFLALVGALLALFLSAVQTYFTVFK